MLYVLTGLHRFLLFLQLVDPCECCNLKLRGDTVLCIWGGWNQWEKCQKSVITMVMFICTYIIFCTLLICFYLVWAWRTLSDMYCEQLWYNGETIWQGIIFIVSQSHVKSVKECTINECNFYISVVSSSPFHHICHILRSEWGGGNGKQKNYPDAITWMHIVLLHTSEWDCGTFPELRCACNHIVHSISLLVYMIKIIVQLSCQIFAIVWKTGNDGFFPVQ